MARRSKLKRTCAQCGGFNPSIYPSCENCRREGCQKNNAHLNPVPGMGTHYDPRHALVCDHCGMLLTDKLKRKGRQFVKQRKFMRDRAKIGKPELVSQRQEVQ